MMTMATPLSAVRTTLELSCFSCVRAAVLGKIKVVLVVMVFLLLFEDFVDV